MSSHGLLVKNVVNASGQLIEIEVTGEVITQMSASVQSDFPIFDGQGLLVLPGLVDLHTHLREPGKEDSETVLSGSQAAARGGYTAVSAMANTFPVADTAGVVEQVARLGKEAGQIGRAHV